MIQTDVICIVTDLCIINLFVKYHPLEFRLVIFVIYLRNQIAIGIPLNANATL